MTAAETLWASSLKTPDGLRALVTLEQLQTLEHATINRGFPGRCGAPSPTSSGLPAITCDLRYGHYGQHEGRTYPPGLLTTGIPTHWDGDWR